ncbi:universal stress protein [Halocatena halophila]|uniref:universal stress protein n=1 Tax=Halocatena halophila TaxID=2814576 RepID=UPI0038B26B2B
MYESILIPYDGSDGAATILHHAGELAHWAGATVQVLYVADTTRDSVTVIKGNTVDALAERGETVVSEAGDTLDSLGVEYSTDVVQGNPAPTIAEYAERYGYDLVVLPTHGRTGLSRYLIGSTTEKVVRLSSVPVLTARMQPDEQFAFPYDDVLIPTDGSETAAHAATHGLSLASSLAATVHVLSVVDANTHDTDLLSTESAKAPVQPAQDAIDELVSMAAEQGIDTVEQHLETDSPVDGILDCIETNDIDAVVMGTTGRRGTERILLGSVAETAVRSVPVPVITVGSEDAAHE